MVQWEWNVWLKFKSLKNSSNNFALAKIRTREKSLVAPYWSGWQLNIRLLRIDISVICPTISLSFIHKYIWSMNSNCTKEIASHCDSWSFVSQIFFELPSPFSGDHNNHSSSSISSTNKSKTDYKERDRMMNQWFGSSVRNLEHTRLGCSSSREVWIIRVHDSLYAIFLFFFNSFISIRESKSQSYTHLGTYLLIQIFLLEVCFKVK